MYKSYVKTSQKKGFKKLVPGYFAREEDAAKAADIGRIQNARWHDEPGIMSSIVAVISVSVWWYCVMMTNPSLVCVVMVHALHNSTSYVGHACLLQTVKVSINDLVPYNVLCGACDRVRRLWTQKKWWRNDEGHRSMRGHTACLKSDQGVEAVSARPGVSKVVRLFQSICICCTVFCGALTMHMQR